jgi:hypothetical protein
VMFADSQKEPSTATTVEAKSRDGHVAHTPFEFRALEAIMNAMQQTLEGNFSNIKSRLEEQLAALSHRASSRALISLRDDQTELNELNSRAKGVRASIAEVSSWNLHVSVCVRVFLCIHIVLHCVYVCVRAVAGR